MQIHSIHLNSNHIIFQNETTVSSCCSKIKNVLNSIWEFIKKIFCCSYEKEDDRSNACPICFCPIEDPAQLPCGHLFDFECIQGWLTAEKSNRCCPLDQLGPYKISQIQKV